ncbi:hypothetical protein LguiA_000179 [Lonicera macranthoides]
MDWVRVRPSSFSRSWKGPWGLKKITEAVIVAIFLIATFSFFMAIGRRRRKFTLGQSGSCQFPAVYNFGDSNSDTGSVSATFGRAHLPNGQTFFGKPSGRYSDGRLVIDFIAEKLGLSYLSAYLDSIETNFRHGANFAASGSTIQSADAKMLKGRFNPICLKVQLMQFEQFKERTAELYNQAKNSHIKRDLPRPEDFSKALYTLDTGQNDLHAGITSMAEEQVKTHIPYIIDELASAVKKLNKQGARAFWIHNTGPIGCLPYFVINYPPKPGNADQNGCVESYNDLAQEFNKQLKDKVSQLRTQLHDAFISYVDVYSAKYDLISEAKKHGFSDPLGYCCGHHGDYHVGCGDKVIVNGSDVYGGSCSNPLEYISWDSIHYTEAANNWVANHILDGSVSDPRIPITEACCKSTVQSQS